jgi:hypothetical protein
MIDNDCAAILSVCPTIAPTAPIFHYFFCHREDNSHPLLVSDRGLLFRFTDYRLLAGYNVGFGTSAAFKMPFCESDQTLLFHNRNFVFTTCFAILLAIFLNGRLPLNTIFPVRYFFLRWCRWSSSHRF